MTAVDVRVEEAVGWITVHRPEARNAMTFAMYDAFAEVCADLNNRAGVRVVVIRGGGGTFLAGTDIGEFRQVRTGEDALAYEQRIDRVMDALERMRPATIALIEGAAVGGGFAMALACDLRYAAADARLGVPIARTLGNCLSMANYGRLLDAVGAARAKELLITARLLSAEEAQVLGLVSAVVPPDELEGRVREAAEAISRHAPLTIQISKEAIRRMQAQRRVVDGRDLIQQAYTSEDFREGVAAFLERRPAVWRGR